MLSSLFEPLTIGNIELKNRIAMVPVVTRLDLEGQIAFYTARAQGGVGLIQLPPGHVDARATEGDTIGLCEDSAIPSFKRLVDAIHTAGAKVSITLFHAGAQLRSTDPGVLLVAPSPVPWSKRAAVPRELTIDEIEELVEKFIQAAERAKKAGCDFVEIGAAHGYLISEFLSPRSNKRADKYGGDEKGRAQCAVEIIQGIKKRLGNDYPVSIRMNGADNIEGGLTIEDTTLIAPLLADAGLDLISVSAGVYGAYPPVIPTYDVPPGCFVSYAGSIKSVVNIPVIAVGRINDPQLADDIIREGKADIVGMGRPLIADPRLPDKASRGEVKDICKCLACNNCNVPHTPIRCAVNATVGKEAQLKITTAAAKKKVMVIGGGPAGLEAARVAALRGHNVTLYEKESRIGGQWLLAATPPHKQDFLDFIEYESYQLEKARVKVQTGKQVTVSLVEEEKPDVVILATGAVPREIPIDRNSGLNVMNAWDILRGTGTPENKVLVIGGGSVGLETAHLLSEQGKEVTVIEMLAHIGVDMIPEVRWVLLNELTPNGVKIFRSTKLEQVTGNGIVVTVNDTQETWTGFDTIVTAVGSKSLNELEEKLRGIVKEVYVIGDAAKPRKCADAVLEGAETGSKI